MDAALGIFEKSSFSTMPCSPPRMQMVDGESMTSQMALPVAAWVFRTGHASGALSWLMVMPSSLAAGLRMALVCAS